MTDVDEKVVHYTEGSSAGSAEARAAPRRNSPPTTSRSSSTTVSASRFRASMAGNDNNSDICPAKAAVKLPEGYRMVWSGRFEDQQRALARLYIIVPLVISL